jgi:prophage regulatory protein
MQHKEIAMTPTTVPRRALRIREVSAKTGIGQSSIWRLTKRGLFPQPIKISQSCTAWFEHEIEEFLDSKVIERGA